jgi:hypothetical protein
MNRRAKEFPGPELPRHRHDEHTTAAYVDNARAPMPSDPQRDYSVGYGKPPRHTRFTKGQSGRRALIRSLTSRASGFAVANGSVPSIHILIARQQWCRCDIEECSGCAATTGLRPVADLECVLWDRQPGTH